MEDGTDIQNYTTVWGEWQQYVVGMSWLYLTTDLYFSVMFGVLSERDYETIRIRLHVDTLTFTSASAYLTENVL